MFVYTQAARECCSEPRSLHRILLAKLMMCCAGWGREGWGGGGTRHSPALGPRCFLSACWKSTNAPVMGQINREPCAAAAPAMPCGTSKRALNIQLLFSLALFFYFFRLPRSLPFSWTLVIKQINLSPTSAERV